MITVKSLYPSISTIAIIARLIANMQKKYLIAVSFPFTKLKNSDDFSFDDNSVVATLNNAIKNIVIKNAKKMRYFCLFLRHKSAMSDINRLKK